MTRTTTFLVTIVTVLASCKLSCLAPGAELLDAPIAAKLQVGGEPSDGGFDHAPFHRLLEQHVRTETGRVDYTSLKEDEARLDSYLTSLGEVDLQSLGPPAKKALLLNAYNAFTLKLILEHYPGLESIKDLDDPWGTKRWTLGGEKVSLDDIEHGLLRPIFKDPRVHFGVNCASIGCPPLADFAYTGDEVDRQLEEVTRNALRNPRYAEVSDGRLHLTRILQWYGDDFTRIGWSPTAESIPEFVARYGSPDVKKLVDTKAADTPVEFLEYDWRLNDTRSK